MVLLFVISLLVNVGMWLERLWLVITSLAHDFLPHNWGGYLPTWVEIDHPDRLLLVLLPGFLVFAKFLPAVPMSDVKN